jgi:hypothetical protein
LKFPLVISTGSAKYRLTVERIHLDKTFEQFKIYPDKDTSKFIVLQSNRPMIRGKRLKHKAIDWKVLEGEIKYRSSLEQAIKAIEQYLEPPAPHKPGLPIQPYKETRKEEKPQQPWKDRLS